MRDGMCKRGENKRKFRMLKDIGLRQHGRRLVYDEPIKPQA